VTTPPLEEAETLSAQEATEFSPAQFVRWFREVAPYVHAFRGKTFVVAFGGELVQANALNNLIEDLSLLSIDILTAQMKIPIGHAVKMVDKWKSTTSPPHQD